MMSSSKLYFHRKLTSLEQLRFKIRMLRTQIKMARSLTVFFLIFTAMNSTKSDDHGGFLTALEEKLENKLSIYGNNFALWLENLNDKHLKNSELGRMLNYDGIKPKLNKIAVESRSMKKLSMVLLPIIFHVGATSTWLVLTALMAAKSVAIGLLLLVFKIAVSSAKVASFFTAWQHKDHHHEPWTPHFEHGHYRSMQDAGTHIEPYVSYNPDPVWNTAYKTLPSSDTDYHEIHLSENISDKHSE